MDLLGETFRGEYSKLHRTVHGLLAASGSVSLHELEGWEHPASPPGILVATLVRLGLVEISKRARQLRLTDSSRAKLASGEWGAADAD